MHRRGRARVKKIVLANRTKTRNRRRPWTTILGYADSFAENAGDTLLLLGRLAIGTIFFNSGFAKLMSLDVFSVSLAARGVPFPSFWGPIGAVSEFVGGTAIILGLATRYATALIVIFIVIATAIAHRYWEFADAAIRTTHSINFYKNLAIIGGALFLFIIGAGRYSVDRLLSDELAAYQRRVKFKK